MVKEFVLLLLERREKGFAQGSFSRRFEQPYPKLTVNFF